VCVCVVGEEQAKSQLSLASTSQLSLSVSETDLSNLTATIKRPSGLEEPCGLKRQPSGQLGQCHTTHLSSPPVFQPQLLFFSAALLEACFCADVSEMMIQVLTVYRIE